MHFSDPCFPSRLDDGLAETRSRARSVSRAILHRTTLSIEGPEDLLALLARVRRERRACFFWERPADQTAILGVGDEWHVTARGTDRFDSVLGACQRIARDVVTDSQTASAALPLFLGGFAFSSGQPETSGSWHDFPPAYLFVPRILIVRRGRMATLTVSTLVRPGHDLDLAGRAATEVARLLQGGVITEERAGTTPGSIRYEAVANPAPASWKDAVADTVTDIRSGRFEKLVLARTCRITSTTGFDTASILQRLRQRYPTCATFCLSRADAAFVGATPEHLVRLHEGVVEASAIAGSIARGGSPGEDRMLARALIDSTKDRGEQAVVVRALAAALEEVCESVEVACEPEILPLENVQHLRTTLRGRLRAQRHVLDLVRILHPTPAVGGFPREDALAAMRVREVGPRGWYAGPLGWMDETGNGEFWVALRCALLHDDEATLYAGAGIVADSDPEAELAETRLKLQPMLSALMEL